MQPINILHVIARLPVGGVENQLSLIVKNYNRKKLFPLVCSLSDKGEIGREIEDSGIEIISLNKLNHKFDWTIVRDIYNLIKKRDIKIVRTHQYHANLYGRLAAIFARVPCIIASVHNVYTRDKKFHRRIINKYLAKFTDKIVAVSKVVKSDIVKYDRLKEDKVVVIYNGIDKDVFLNVQGDVIRSELGLSQEVPVIGTIGRLTSQKGQKYLLEAVSRIKDKFPQIVLLIVGDGLLRYELENCAGSLGIKGNVFFLGNRRDIPSILSAMDIFILPSLWEGLSNAILEAMVAGKPIIATDIPQNREILKNIGIFVPPKNGDSIADAIKFLLHNKTFAENLGDAAKESALFYFDVEKTVDTYSNLFESILNRKNSEKSKRPKGGKVI